MRVVLNYKSKSPSRHNVFGVLFATEFDEAQPQQLLQRYWQQQSGGPGVREVDLRGVSVSAPQNEFDLRMFYC